MLPRVILFIHDKFVVYLTKKVWAKQHRQVRAYVRMISLAREHLPSNELTSWFSRQRTGRANKRRAMSNASVYIGSKVKGDIWDTRVLTGPHHCGSHLYTGVFHGLRRVRTYYLLASTCKRKFINEIRSSQRRHCVVVECAPPVLEEVGFESHARGCVVLCVLCNGEKFLPYAVNRPQAHLTACAYSRTGWFNFQKAHNIGGSRPLLVYATYSRI